MKPTHKKPAPRTSPRIVPRAVPRTVIRNTPRIYPIVREMDSQRGPEGTAKLKEDL